MDASAYALVHGIRSTRATLAAYSRRQWPTLRGWLAGSLAAASALLAAVWVIAALAPGDGFTNFHSPPLGVGQPIDVVRILSRNSLVLALHAMACVAGFMAGSSLPMQARQSSAWPTWPRSCTHPPVCCSWACSPMPCRS